MRSHRTPNGLYFKRPILLLENNTNCWIVTIFFCVLLPSVLEHIRRCFPNFNGLLDARSIWRMKSSPQSISKRDKIPIWIFANQKAINTITGSFYSIIYFNNYVSNQFTCIKLFLSFFTLWSEVKKRNWITTWQPLSGTLMYCTVQQGHGFVEALYALPDTKAVI